MNKLFGLVSFIALLASGQAASAKCLHYDLPAVEITGVLTRAASPAVPPTSGTATPDYSWYFEPTRPPCIAAGPKSLGNAPVRSAGRFEVLPPTGLRLDSYLGAPVALKGWFVPTQVPHHHQLTFSVESAKPGHAP